MVLLLAWMRQSIVARAQSGAGLFASWWEEGSWGEAYFFK